MLENACFRSEPYQPSDTEASLFMIQQPNTSYSTTLNQVKQTYLVNLYDDNLSIIGYGVARFYTHLPLKP
jgi:hypothetical protein